MGPLEPLLPKDIVLVVEDDLALGAIVVTVLLRLGYPSLLVETVAAATEALAKQRFRLVLLDLGLPNVSGHALLRALERSPGSPPIIVMSGSGALEDVIEVMRRRAVDFLRKPFRPEDLSTAIDRALASRGPGDLPSGDRATNADAPVVPALDADAVLSAQVRARIEKFAQERGLTPREREVLDLVLLGRGHTEIGTALGISARTAKFHLSNVLTKFGADSRADLLRVLL